MSTRCQIAIKLKDSDTKKVLKCEPSLIDSAYLYKGINAKYIGNVDYTDKMSDGDNYLWITCHFDGYPEGVGEELKNKFNTYEKALNLVLAGHMSSICDKIDPYSIREDNWEDNKPILSNNMEELLDSFSESDREYLYIFENNQWKIN